MRLMTWNINSLRLRLPLLQRLDAQHRPDVICLQETKVSDPLFPLQALQALGFEHVHFAGMKSYNGVAILSRLPFTPMTELPVWCQRNDCRHIGAAFETPTGPLLLHNFYVPAGGDVPDVALNDKFAHKLDFVDEVTRWFTDTPPRRSVLVGDLNIAPLEQDVWSHKQLLNVISHTPPETSRMADWIGTGFVDAMRHIVPPSEKLYTWWSYRNRDWRASNRGRRLDHVWLTPDLMDRLKDIEVLQDVRGWESPSDHVPVIADIDIVPTA
ncbi:exodeoxyribonuclease III [Kozakia baliensis]|nr:exodeoxyribonuclease III [Kozakia baliensis]GBR24426.1 exodeoxyribonuclease III [Kozakia baliensis NRIC 0488]